MAMQDGLVYPAFTRCTSAAPGSAVTCMNYTGTNLRCIGTRNQLSPVASGYFIPGKLRLNPVVIEKGLGVSTPADLEWKWAANNQVSRRFSGDLLASFASATYLDPPVYPTSAANNCVIRAKAKMNTADADIALMLGELGETLRMLRNPFKGLISFLKTAKKSGKALPNFASDSWLLYRYGVMPFISDIESIIQLFQNKAQNLDGFVTKRSGLTWETNDELLRQVQVTKEGLLGDWICRVKTTHSLMAHVYADIDISVLNNRLSASRFGFDPRQMPALMWELIPYSFVVDWFISVGAFLNAIMPINGTYLGACVSYKTKRELTFEVSNFKSGIANMYLTNGVPGKYIWTAERLQRVVVSTSMVFPSFNVERFQIKQLLDSLALLWQKIPRR